MTTNFPGSLDNDATIGLITNNISTIGGLVINQIRDAVFALEGNIGINAQGATSSIAQRLNQSLDASGNIKASVIASIPALANIVDSQVSPTAAIQESKIALNYTTSYLNNYINNVNVAAQTGLSFISNHGYKLEPHIAGSGYNHYLNGILIAISSGQYFNNASGAVRDNTNLYSLFNDINDDLISHEVSNGTPVSFVSGLQVGGTLPPANYGHVSAGIHVNSSTFSFIPQTITDVQALADFIDSSNILILGTRIQTLYANGIPVNARAGALPNQNLGQLIIPITSATTYLLYGGANAPFDNIDHGDDLIEFFPSAGSISNSSFDAMFNLIKPGDVITVDFDGYGSFPIDFDGYDGYLGFTTQHIIREIKYSVSGGNKRYVVRINGKNAIGANVLAAVNSPLFDNNKYGVMALAQAPSVVAGTNPTLIVGCPRGAEVLSVGFDPDLLNAAHHFLYIAVYPDGNPFDQIVNMPAIDMTGNAGTTPGSYTLDSVMAALNAQFRTPGYNNRFMAFQHDGELGIKMTDAINNISFSIIDGVVNSAGAYSLASSNTTYPNNATGVPGADPIDATGFTVLGAGVSSPAFSTAYPSFQAALIPTKIWCPLSRKTYYVNGVERESFALEPHQLIDGYGDGYWPASIISRTVIPGVRVEVVYQVPFDLSASSLEIGKTITAISGAGSTFVDDGRYFINNIQFNNCMACGSSHAISTTNITVFDAIQSPSGNTPYASAVIGTSVFLYFSSDAISFNAENSSDWTNVSTFKRSMEIYVDQDGYTFSQERGRMNLNGTSITLNTPISTVSLFSDSNLIQLNMVSISAKLRGYSFATIDKINLTFTSYDVPTGIYSGYLCKWDGSIESNLGPITVGKRGNVVRFYDSSFVEYVDIALDFANSLPAFVSTKRIDIQLFPSLQLDEEIMLLGTVQVNETTFGLDWLQDRRQFGNVSEEQLTTSALNYISAPTQLINENGIIRGFDITSAINGVINVDGGVAVVNGKIIQLGAETVLVPAIVEVLYPAFTTVLTEITWYLCINDKGEFELVASSDFDPFGGKAASYAAANLDHNRVFYASNQVVGNVYPIRATYFSDLVLNNRDVVPIALITATTTGGASPVITTTAFDMRRFMSGGYAGLAFPFVLSTYGSFRSVASLNTWLIQLVNWNASSDDDQNFVGAKVLVKGSFPITSSTTLSFLKPVIFVGDGGTFEVSTPVAFNLGNRISFDGITFNYNYDPLVLADPGYVSANLVNSQNGCLYCSVGLNQNVSIKNCIFNWFPADTSTAVNRYPFISFQFLAVGDVIENVDISNNIFKSNVSTFTAPNQIDIRAAIAFIAAFTGIPAINTGAQLVDSNITYNKCYQDQMIIVSTTLHSGSLVAGITPINTNIMYNQCGTIGMITRYYYTNDFQYFNISPGGRNPSITISNNTCKLIDCLDAAGAELWYSIVADGNFYSCSSIIENNTASWIRVLVNQGTTAPAVPPAIVPVSIIKHNILSAYNAIPGSPTNYRINYNTLYGPATSDNAAVSIVNPAASLTNTSGSIVIDGNQISQGKYSFITGLTEEDYYYDVGILSQHNSTIVNNIISTLGKVISGSDPIGIFLVSQSSIVENNTLTRGAATWSAYVSAGNVFFPLAQHTITNNTFDQTTINGISTIQISHLANNTNVYANINQIGYAAISWVDNKTYANVSGGTNPSTSPANPVATFYTDAVSGFFMGRMAQFTNTEATSVYLHIHDNLAFPTEINASFLAPVDIALPINVKILSATMGVWITYDVGATPSLNTTGTPPIDNKITLSLLSVNNINASNNPTQGITDVKSNVSFTSPPTDNIENFITSTMIVGPGVPPYLVPPYVNEVLGNGVAAVTQYLTVSIPLASQTYYTTTGKTNKISVALDFNELRLLGSAGVHWWISPVLIQYQW